MAHIQDRLSILPETLLITILSLLPLKDAVRTSILGKQWRNLWLFRPNIEINERHFPPFYNHRETQDEKLLRETACINFGRRWLQALNNNPRTISSFTLKFSNPFAFVEDMHHFISFALNHQTNSLELDFKDSNWDTQVPAYNVLDIITERFDLPQFDYQYDSLQCLKLAWCDFREDRLISLGRALKSISFLGWVDIENISRNMMRYCPLLESLNLFKCLELTNCVIESESLKYLAVDKCVELMELRVTAPNLRHFKYCGSIVEFGISHFPELEEANLDFGYQDFFDVEYCCNNIIQVLSNVYFAKTLRVCGLIAQVLSVAMEEPRLQGRAHVEDLTIRTSFHNYELRGIFCLLNSYPFLKKLRFEVGQFSIFEDDIGPLIDWDNETFWTEMRPSSNGCLKRN